VGWKGHRDQGSPPICGNVRGARDPTDHDLDGVTELKETFTSSDFKDNAAQAQYGSCIRKEDEALKAQILVTLLVVLGGAGVPAQGQTGIGKTYHSRDPFVCKSMKDPARGAPSPSQARDYIRCANEKIMGSGLLLYENVQVEVGKSRPFSAGTDSGAGEIDPSQPVYPVRGTWDSYTCWEPTHNGTIGKNCNSQKAAPIAGACYRTSFGDWSCRVRNTSWDTTDTKAGVPPPQ
jgi:hypothetical protein